MLERELQDAIVECAQLLGWKVMHTRPAWTAKGYRTPIQGDVGFPDLVLARGPRMIFVELKSSRGTLSPAQVAWKQALEWAGGTVYVWRPEDWAGGAVETVLRAGTGEHSVAV
jgi:hypothetical protein